MILYICLHGYQIVSFGEDDDENPKRWPLRWKYTQVLLMSIIALICPLASSIQAPAADEIAQAFDTSKQKITGAQAGFVCMLGIGPLFLAPMSETFGECQCLKTSSLLTVSFRSAYNLHDQPGHLHIAPDSGRACSRRQLFHRHPNAVRTVWQRGSG